MLYYIALSLGAFLISLLGTRQVILGLRSNRFLLDMPNARSNHSRPVPRGGGMAVVVTLMIFLTVAEADYFLIGGLLLLAAISLLDDWIRLSPLTRIAAQGVAVMLVLPQVMPPLFDGVLPLFLQQLVFGLAWLWFINLFNFMDGIDGLAGAETISIAFGALVVATLMGTFGSLHSQIALVIFAAGAGFLWWNWHPAKIFLGDVGSIPLGFTLGYLLLDLARQGYFAAALILPAYFVADATYTLFRRAWRGEKVWEAHSEHAYQKAVRAGRPHDEVTTFIIGLNFLLVLLAAFAVLFPEMAVFNTLIAYTATAFIIALLSRGGRLLSR